MTEGDLHLLELGADDCPPQYGRLVLAAVAEVRRGEQARQALLDANPLVFGANGTIDHGKTLAELAMLAAERMEHLQKLHAEAWGLVETRGIENGRLKAELAALRGTTPTPTGTRPATEDTAPHTARVRPPGAVTK